MSGIETDICVIGAGSGGLSVASGAAQMGARVVLIEGGAMGGDCLNAGCVPSKALLAAARGGLAFEAARAHVKRVIAEIAPHDSQERFEGLGCTVLRGWARFTGPRAVEVNGTRVRARRFVIATGARPVVPEGMGLEAVPYLTNETLFELPERPEHLVILGGGPIGAEMAEAFCRLGAEVTVIARNRMLAREDPAAAEVVVSALRGIGVRIAQGVTVRAVRQGGEGVVLEASDGQVFTGSHLLVATGRRPALAQLDLPSGGVAMTAQGGVAVDARLRSRSNKRVFALGDALGGRQFTHLAGYQAGVVVQNVALGVPAKAREDHVPRVTYTAPELAQVGMTEAEARAAFGEALDVVRAEMAEVDRARTDALPDGDGAPRRQAGFLKLMIHKGRIKGATIVGHGAGEMAAVYSLILAKRLKARDISVMIAPYPTMADLHKRAVGTYFTPKLFHNKWVKRVVRLIQRLP